MKCVCWLVCSTRLDVYISGGHGLLKWHVLLEGVQILEKNNIVETFYSMLETIYNIKLYLYKIMGIICRHVHSSMN